MRPLACARNRSKVAGERNDGSDIVTVFVAWVLLHGMSASLALVGFDRTLQLTRRIAPDPERTGAGGDVALVRRVSRAIGRAKRWHLRMTPDDCLPVALAGVCMLRRLGVPADLVLGVQTFPFDAHAWVEAGRHIIDFPSDRYTRFSGVKMIDSRRDGRC